MASASTDIWRAAAVSAAAAAAETDTVGSMDVSEVREASAAIAFRAPVRCCNAAMSGLCYSHSLRLYYIIENLINKFNFNIVVAS